MLLCATTAAYPLSGLRTGAGRRQRRWFDKIKRLDRLLAMKGRELLDLHQFEAVAVAKCR